MCYQLLKRAQPNFSGHQTVAGLQQAASVEFDQLAVPRIQAKSRVDAYFTLGYLAAKERLFQMDLMRRNSAGELSEIIGPAALDKDIWHRTMGFKQVARQILTSLNAPQREVLRSYVAGVNAALSEIKVLPLEFHLLNYEPQPWTEEDSLLVVLGMYETLSWSGDEEIMATVMLETLPQEVVDFLLPKTDLFTAAVNHESFDIVVPVQALATLNAEQSVTASDSVRMSDIVWGSNAWAIAPHKTRDGKAMLANDMHLELRVPNIWYRAQLQYDDRRVVGVTLPGVPAVIAGSNGHIAWGFTNVQGDFVDLVRLEANPQSPHEYKTDDGWIRFSERQETIRVRHQADQVITLLSTKWGPVWHSSARNEPVAVRWTALDPLATNLDILELDGVLNVSDALAHFNRMGTPPLNGLVSDNSGNIGWTYTGRFPIRDAYEGSFTQTGISLWQGYIKPNELPRVINPPAGFIANANQRMIASDYPYFIGRNFANGYRAYRINEVLQQSQQLTETDLLQLQLDRRAEFYGYYQTIALSALANPAGKDHEMIDEIRDYLQAWDGQANLNSQGIALLTAYRRALGTEVFSKLVARCKARMPSFSYHWLNIDVPLQAIINSRDLRLLPKSQFYRDWDDFLFSVLEKTVLDLKRQYQVEHLEELTWGRVNRVDIGHPLTKAIPQLASLLNMPAEPIPGCPHCVRVVSDNHGASERLVVAPGHETTGILHIPAGQSGHPLSDHYRDQQALWMNGEASPLLTGQTVQRLQLVPKQRPSD